MKRITAIFAAAALFNATAYAEKTAESLTFETLEASVASEAEAAIAAINSNDLQSASALLQSASANANRLALRVLTQNLAAATPSFTAEDAIIAATQSSTVNLGDFLSNRDVLERNFATAAGESVTVRVFGGDDDLDDFVTLAQDDAMVKKAGLETAEMRGETALKKRGQEGALSVLMMSEDDHALIEVEGASEETVMKFIGELEASDG